MGRCLLPKVGATLTSVQVVPKIARSLSINMRLEAMATIETAFPLVAAATGRLRRRAKLHRMIAASVGWSVAACEVTMQQEKATVVATVQPLCALNNTMGDQVL